MTKTVRGMMRVKDRNVLFELNGIQVNDDRKRSSFRVDLVADLERLRNRDSRGKEFTTGVGRNEFNLAGFRFQQVRLKDLLVRYFAE